MLLTEKEIKMKKKIIISLLSLALTAFLLTACGDSEENASAKKYITPTAENGKIVIDTEILSEHAIFVNYNSNGTNIQLIAVNASDGLPRLSLNTCQACNPAPKAYFEEEKGRLVCQNCGNVFAMDSVGEKAGGCNPMNIAYEIGGDNITVRTAVLDSYADKFASWSGTVE